MNDLDSLYRAVIMDHYKNPRNKGLVNHEPYVKFHIKNPSCGDDITVEAKIDNGVIVEIHHEGKGCSICCSSASVMSETLVGKTLEEANELIENYFHLVKGEPYDSNLDLGDAFVYQGVQKFPARVKCASISWLALQEIIEGIKNGKK